MCFVSAARSGCRCAGMEWFFDVFGVATLICNPLCCCPCGVMLCQELDCLCEVVCYICLSRI